jgi:formate/nitrite transporter
MASLQGQRTQVSMDNGVHFLSLIGGLEMGAVFFRTYRSPRHGFDEMACRGLRPLHTVNRPRALQPAPDPKEHHMAYLVPSEFVTKMVDAGEAKIFMSTRDTVIRAFMAGAILALAAAFAVTINVQTGQPLAGAVLFPVGFCILYLLGFDLLTGVMTLCPLALIDKRPGVTVKGILRNWTLVFFGNFGGAFTVAVMMAIIFTFGFSSEPNAVGKAIGHIGEGRTVGYSEHGAAGMLTLFVRGVLCNWMVSTGVVGAMVSTHVSGKVIAMWMPIMLFFYMGFEHSIVNMFLFPSGLMLGGNFSIMDYLIWNEIPTVLGNLVGGLAFVGLTLYSTHVRTAPKRVA